MAFTGFGKGAMAFYADLEANNSREWWLPNKRRYEDEVKADVTAHDVLKTAPRGYPKDHPRIDLLRMAGIIGIWEHKPGAWLSTAKVKDRVVDGWRQLRPLNDWLARNL